MGPILFLPAAITDVQQAVRWYDRQLAGLGQLFLNDLDRQVRRVSQFPQSYPRLNATCRRANLQRFPYTIIYRALAAELQVVAVFHYRADPIGNVLRDS